MGLIEKMAKVELHNTFKIHELLLYTRFQLSSVWMVGKALCTQYHSYQEKLQYSIRLLKFRTSDFFLAVRERKQHFQAKLRYFTLFRNRSLLTSAQNGCRSMSGEGRTLQRTYTSGWGNMSCVTIACPQMNIKSWMNWYWVNDSMHFFFNVSCFSNLFSIIFEPYSRTVKSVINCINSKYYFFFLD